jgi:hypothetical protein
MKKCPFCAENIPDDTTKCIYCGENLAINEGGGIKSKPYVFYALVVLLLGAGFILMWGHYKNEELEIQKAEVEIRQQQKIAAEIKIKEEQNKLETQREQAQRQSEAENLRLQENIRMADNQRRRALAECLDRVDERFKNMPDMNVYQAQAFLPYVIAQKKLDAEKCYKVYGER